MKIEYIAKATPDPLIRLFAFSRSEVALLHERLTALADGAHSRVDVGALPNIEAVEDCRLVFEAGKRDEGVVQLGPNSFVCRLTAGTWDNVAGLVEPFLTGSTEGSHQWLDQWSGISLLLSPDGLW